MVGIVRITANSFGAELFKENARNILRYGQKVRTFYLLSVSMDLDYYIISKNDCEWFESL